MLPHSLFSKPKQNKTENKKDSKVNPIPQSTLENFTIPKIEIDDQLQKIKNFHLKPTQIEIEPITYQVNFQQFKFSGSSTVSQMTRDDRKLDIVTLPQLL